MTSFGSWAGLPADLLRSISDGFGLSLGSYSYIRGVCTTWRSALPPPTPLLLTVSGSDAPRHREVQPGHILSASFLTVTADRSFRFSKLPTRGELVGSSNGWIAVDGVWPGILLLNPLTGCELYILPLKNNEGPVVKVAFAPIRRPEDYTAVAICGGGRNLAYAKARDFQWTVMDVAMADERDELVDLVYDVDGGKVYCVTAHRDVHMFPVVVSGFRRRRPRVSPLHAKQRAGIFAPPYDTASKLTGAKNIFLSGGSLYQVWRNTTCAVSKMMPGGGRFGMAKDEVFVLKYDPNRRPCWDAVSDLGGCSVFVGKNSPAVLRPEDATGVRPNCVYWIDEQSRFAPMVFDMPTKTSTLHPLAAKALCSSQRPACWFFLNDKIVSINSDAENTRDDA